MHLCTAAIYFIWLYSPIVSQSSLVVSLLFLLVASWFLYFSLFFVIPPAWVELSFHCEWEKSACLLRRTTCFQLCGPSIPQSKSDRLMSSKKIWRANESKESAYVLQAHPPFDCVDGTSLCHKVQNSVIFIMFLFLHSVFCILFSISSFYSQNHRLIWVIASKCPIQAHIDENIFSFINWFTATVRHTSPFGHDHLTETSATWLKSYVIIF